jgi:cytochrome P450
MGLTTAELQSLPLFGDCAEDDLRSVIDAVAAERDIVEGDVVCTEGDKADRWWIVTDGTADVTVNGLYTATIGPGETIGELALLDGEPRAATVKAVSDMHLYEVDGHAFIDALLAHPRLAVAVLRQLAVRLRVTNLRPVPPAIRTARAVPRVAADLPTTFDPRVPGFLDDPAAHLAACREAAAVHWSDAIASFVVTRYDDVFRLSRSRALRGSVTLTDLSTERRPGWRMMINRDGEDHLRLRRLVSKVFTPRAIGAWRERAESIVERLLDAADGRDDLDVMTGYALPLPAQVITEMLGMPPDDTPQLREWSRILTRGLDPFFDEGDEEERDAAGRAMTEYIEAVIVDKRAHPSDDILTALLEAEDAGDVLDDREVLAQVLLLYIAGHETTLNLIGNGVTHLFEFPDELARLRADPALDANAVEEVLRFESPAQLTRRTNLEDVMVDDTVIPAGSHITLSLASANHDPRKWGPTADVIDVARPGANEHVSFGGGVHFCLGASLARMEAGVALPRLLRRFPAMAPAYDRPQWVPRVTLRGVETLPVTLRP